MTEAEWLVATDPKSMALCIDYRVRKRKAALLGAAIYRYLWHPRTDETIRSLIDIMERYADGAASEQDVARGRTAVRNKTLLIPGDGPEVQSARCRFIREVFGNPFRPV